jgi:hypothetical protein
VWASWHTIRITTLLFHKYLQIKNLSLPEPRKRPASTVLRLVKGKAEVAG